MGILKKDNSYVYAILERDFEEQIRKGILAPGECILSEIELARKYNISRRSSRQAISNLVDKKLLRRIPGKGTFVCDVQERRIHYELVSFIVPDVGDLFITEVLKGLQEAVGNGYKLIIQSSSRQPERENENIELLIQQNVSGAVIFPNWGRLNAETVLRLKKSDVPFVLIDRYFRDIDTDYVVVDNRGGAFKAVAHLAKLGHRRIGHLYGTEGTANDDRLEGYRDALADAGIVYSQAFVRRIPSSVKCDHRFEPDYAGGYEAMKQLLALPERPSAVFAGNDYLAIGAMKALKEAGLRIPGDMALVGFDDLSISAILDPSLTTVRQPKNEIGRKAAEILTEKIQSMRNGKPREMAHVVLPTELVVRESSGG